MCFAVRNFLIRQEINEKKLRLISLITCHNWFIPLGGRWNMPEKMLKHLEGSNFSICLEVLTWPNSVIYVGQENILEIRFKLKITFSAIIWFTEFSRGNIYKLFYLFFILFSEDFSRNTFLSRFSFQNMQCIKFSVNVCHSKVMEHWIKYWHLCCLIFLCKHNGFIFELSSYV